MFGGLLGIGSMLNFFGKSIGAGMLNFSEVALVVVVIGGSGLGMFNFVVPTDMSVGVSVGVMCGSVVGVGGTVVVVVGCEWTSVVWGGGASCSQACIFIGIVIELGICFFFCFCVWG